MERPEYIGAIERHIIGEPVDVWPAGLSMQITGEHSTVLRASEIYYAIRLNLRQIEPDGLPENAVRAYREKAVRTLLRYLYGEVTAELHTLRDELLTRHGHSWDDQSVRRINAMINALT